MVASDSALRAGVPVIGTLLLFTVGITRVHRVLLLPGLLLTAWSVWFFRDPVRACPADPDTVYAAADGRVMVVDEVQSDWHVIGPSLRIAIFLSPLDVHVNRSPIAGQLVATRRDPGRFAPAFLARQSAGNAQQRLGIQVVGRPGPAARLVVIQIVGFMARRIVSWRHAGDGLAAGEKIGMIRFGSRTDVILPAAVATPLIQPGDRVLAGITPIARYR